MAAEKQETVDMTDQKIQKELDDYQSLISQGEGAQVLFSWQGFIYGNLTGGR